MTQNICPNRALLTRKYSVRDFVWIIGKLWLVLWVCVNSSKYAASIAWHALRMTVFVILKQQVNRHVLSLVTFMTCYCFFRACDDDGYVWWVYFTIMKLRGVYPHSFGLFFPKFGSNSSTIFLKSVCLAMTLLH